MGPIGCNHGNDKSTDTTAIIHCTIRITISIPRYLPTCRNGVKEKGLDQTDVPKLAKCSNILCRVLV